MHWTSNALTWNTNAHTWNTNALTWNTNALTWNTNALTWNTNAHTWNTNALHSVSQLLGWWVGRLSRKIRTRTRNNNPGDLFSSTRSYRPSGSAEHFAMTQETHFHAQKKDKQAETERYAPAFHIQVLVDKSRLPKCSYSG